MQILQEVTDWGKYNTPNHIYHVLDNGKMVAYDNGSGLQTFSRPLMFEKTRRKFVVLADVPEIDPTAVQVQGSNGAVYTVKDGKCTCPGFTFRGKCKHTA